MVYEVETIKRQAKLRSVSWSWASLWAQAQPMAYTPYASLACDMTSASEVAVCDLRRSTSVIYLCLCLCLIQKNSYKAMLLHHLCWFQLPMSLCLSFHKAHTSQCQCVYLY